MVRTLFVYLLPWRPVKLNWKVALLLLQGACYLPDWVYGRDTAIKLLFAYMMINAMARNKVLKA